METFNVLLMLSVCVYGISFGVANWCRKLYAACVGIGTTQIFLGKLLDAVWLISVVYLAFVLKYGTEKVLAFIYGVV